MGGAARRWSAARSRRSLELLAELRARGVRCYALTNMEAETYPLRRDRYEFLCWFDGTVVSARGDRQALPGDLPAPAGAVRAGGRADPDGR